MSPIDSRDGPGSCARRRAEALTARAAHSIVAFAAVLVGVVGVSACGGGTDGGVAHQALAVTQAQIANYYARHKQRFRVGERRLFDIDNLRSARAAMKAKREVESGKGFASMSLHEEWVKGAPVGEGRSAVIRAIFLAKPHVLSGPVLLADVGDDSLFEVTHIFPATYEPLARVQNTIAKQLAAERGAART
jgi:2-hydroxychromene-2-carboxylate isomerase